MTYRRGDIVLINFPFTSLLKSKKRPVIIIKTENKYHDFVCFQVTSKNTQSNLCLLDTVDLTEGDLPLESYVKYDKCFTLNVTLVDKKLASVSDVFMEKLKQLFCNEI